MSEFNGREIIVPGARAGVLLPLVFREPFDYRVPDGMEVRAGDWVRVPFGRKSVWGVVWGKGAGEVGEGKLKSIESCAAHIPPMNDAMRAFLDWVAWYTLAPDGTVLKMAIPVPEALEPLKEETRYRLGAVGDLRLTPSRTRILAYLSDGADRSVKEIVIHAKATANVIREMIKADVLQTAGGAPQIADIRTPEKIASGLQPTPDLSADQQAAASLIEAKLSKGFSVTVLDGVTGSGKTEVYFDAIAHVLAQGKQALVMLPEIALSVQWFARFQKRFGFAPAIWHSGIGVAARRDAWRDVALGEARVVVGARSALFLPFARLGIIVVDEEHDASYKQEDGVIYHARDMAVARALHEKIPAILASATPSLETEYNVGQNRYARVHLHSRFGEAELPKVKLIDMRPEKLASGAWISEPLKAALLSTVAKKQQAMLFMNRRGYAPLMLCRACGHRFQCPHCAAFLVMHRARARLMCHHCGHMTGMPKACPECAHENAIIPFGPGVERIAEEVHALLPEARVALMTSDLIDTPAKAETLITSMINGEIDILVGTQMVAKGHHFAGLALVGVMDADMGLAGGDLRAGERTYQMLHQLAGRAGREKVKGEVWLQTYMPEHPVMQALLAGDRDRFMQLEDTMRQEALMPPYGKLAAVIIEGRHEGDVAGFARSLVRSAHEEQKPENGEALPLILGPAPAPMSLLRGKYRYRILIKVVRNFSLQGWMSRWLLAHKPPHAIRMKIDIEPYSFL
jgi:primosomal protein N' (replication factor Y)